ncbi:Dihydrofolate reductase [Geodermatophilus aquaeductus]|uniref:Dihydrofolate reductase n=1 Tax=Geodermatophilus aquaeductus TaxID=1564161 RepID=A0A521DQ18_9ACTN|nr:Dihydrofolate reductase [Geodermatophilus aquaeductus]
MARVRDLVYYIGVSIDGVIAGPDDEVDFYVLGEPFTQWMAAEYADALPTHVRRAMGIDGTPNRRFDTIVMGRRTYDPALAAGIVSPYSHLRQVVVSRTLESPGPEVTVVRDDPLAAVRALKAEDGLDVYLAGGGHLAGQLLGEIDRLVVKQYPVVAGAGRRAFGAQFAPIGFVLDDVRTFPGGPAVLTYSRAR